ncbi:uncharacterized protein LOC117174726 [Belonocnema kinseyi]|uniref:uncharacterized protein LOC117174726 n=1 Tax=Belonocnema kinseyi TaxID=2817044 RepID=UPI00143D5D53|nr:uncharacterized protein LOC117174726 [Belonocnema kinseyi]
MQSKSKQFSVYNFCQFKKCRNTSDKCHLYRFPARGTQRHKEWIKRTGNQEYLQGWTDSSIRKAGICGDHFDPIMFFESCTPGAYKRLAQTAIPEYYCEKIIEPELPEQKILPCQPLLQKANEISNLQVFPEENEFLCKEEYIEIKMEEDSTTEVQSKDSNETCTSGSYQNPIPEPHWETHTEPEQEILPDHEPLFQKAGEHSYQVFLDDSEIVCKKEYIDFKMEEDLKPEVQSKDSNEICTSGTNQNPIPELEKANENSNQVCKEVKNSKIYSKPRNFLSRRKDLIKWNLIDSPYTRRVPPVSMQMLKKENEKLRKEISLWKQNLYAVNQQLHQTRERRNFYKKELQKLRKQTVDEFLDKEGCTEEIARTMVHLQLHKKYEAYSEAEKDLAKLIFHHSASGYMHLRNAGCILPHENHVRKWLKLI